MSVFMIFVLVLSAFSFAVYAKEEENAGPILAENETIEYFSDGSYLITSLDVDQGPIVALSSSKTGSKPGTLYNDSGNKAIGYFVAKHYVLGIAVQTKELTLTCSNTGVLS